MGCGMLPWMHFSFFILQKTFNKLEQIQTKWGWSAQWNYEIITRWNVKTQNNKDPMVCMHQPIQHEWIYLLCFMHNFTRKEPDYHHHPSNCSVTFKHLVNRQIQYLWFFRNNLKFLQEKNHEGYSSCKQR